MFMTLKNPPKEFTVVSPQKRCKSVRRREETLRVPKGSSDRELYHTGMNETPYLLTLSSSL